MRQYLLLIFFSLVLVLTAVIAGIALLQPTAIEAQDGTVRIGNSDEVIALTVDHALESDSTYKLYSNTAFWGQSEELSSHLTNGPSIWVSIN